MTSLELAADPHGDRSGTPLTVGDLMPDFRLPAWAATVGKGWEFDSAWLRGRWSALLYWPRQSCLESATDVAELVSMGSAFTDRETQFVAATSALFPERHRDGRPRGPMASTLPFPVLVDGRGELASALGIDVQGNCRSVRATLVADPAGVIRWLNVSDLPAVRSLREAAEALATARGTAPPAGVPFVGPAAAVDPHGGDLRLIRGCAWCSRLKHHDDWIIPEEYIRLRTSEQVSHGICDECLSRQLPR